MVCVKNCKHLKACVKSAILTRGGLKVLLIAKQYIYIYRKTPFTPPLHFAYPYQSFLPYTFTTTLPKYSKSYTLTAISARRNISSY